MGRIHQRKKAASSGLDTKSEYTTFNALDGWHEWQDVLPNGSVLYPTRMLQEGRVLYFNFKLAKEMGLIEESHPHILNKKLENKILETFNIRIVNEYDQTQNIKYHPTVLKKKPYMATRYLQLQHKNKRGTTSGDGRSIWNGQMTHKGQVWDVSSRGTGVTCLAPGAVEAQKPLKSGSTSFGYGCGLADIDELIGAAIMAETFHNNGINTERVLAVIDNGRGNGIGVRAGKNLFRPAHLFMYLKQGNLPALKKATDFLIQRQSKNGEWQIQHYGKRKYDSMLGEIAESFAQFTAQLDREYIFAWLDWDGDNVLANAGIIDYGSIRQFGLRHDEYRYDDVDRFSTNMQEQRVKARQTVQTFAQLVEYINSGVKRPLKDFSSHWSLKKFDEHFEYYVLDRFLYQVGISRIKREHLLTKNYTLVREFYEEYLNLERLKTQRKTTRVADGINRPAIFNMRKMLYLLPEHFYMTLMSGEIDVMQSQEFFDYALAKSAKGKDKRITPLIDKKIRSFQLKYWEVLARTAKESGMKKMLKWVSEQAYQLHHPNRITGDGLLYVVEEILKFKKKNNDLKSIQTVIDKFIDDHSLNSPSEIEKKLPRLHVNRRAQTLLNTMLSLVDDMKESI